MATRYGERIIGSLGRSALLLGLVWMSRTDATDTFAGGLLGPFVLLGLGAGLTVAPLTLVIMHQAPPAHLGAASSLNQAMQQLGGALGLAVMTTVVPPRPEPERRGRSPQPSPPGPSSPRTER